MPLLLKSLKIDWIEISWVSNVSVQYGDDGKHGLVVGILAESRFEKPPKETVDARIIESVASATIRKIA